MTGWKSSQRRMELELSWREKNREGRKDCKQGLSVSPPPHL